MHACVRVPVSCLQMSLYIYDFIVFASSHCQIATVETLLYVTVSLHPIFQFFQFPLSSCHTHTHTHIVGVDNNDISDIE